MTPSPKPELPTITDLDDEMEATNKRIEQILEALQANPAMLAAYQFGIAHARLASNYTGAVKTLATVTTGDKERNSAVLLMRVDEDEITNLGAAIDTLLQDAAKAQA